MCRKQRRVQEAAVARLFRGCGAASWHGLAQPWHGTALPLLLPLAVTCAAEWGAPRGSHLCRAGAAPSVRSWKIQVVPQVLKAHSCTYQDKQNELNQDNLLNIWEVPKFQSRQEFMSKADTNAVCWEMHPVLQRSVAVTRALVTHPALNVRHSSKACRGGKDNCAALCCFPGIVLQRLTGGLDGFTANSKNPTGV